MFHRHLLCQPMTGIGECPLGERMPHGDGHWRMMNKEKSVWQIHDDAEEGKLLSRHLGAHLSFMPILHSCSSCLLFQLSDVLLQSISHLHQGMVMKVMCDLLWMTGRHPWQDRTWLCQPLSNNITQSATVQQAKQQQVRMRHLCMQAQHQHHQL